MLPPVAALLTCDFESAGFVMDVYGRAAVSFHIVTRSRVFPFVDISITTV
jgi:hypothetical protein